MSPVYADACNPATGAIGVRLLRGQLRVARDLSDDGRMKPTVVFVVLYNHNRTPFDWHSWTLLNAYSNYVASMNCHWY